MATKPLSYWRWPLIIVALPGTHVGLMLMSVAIISRRAGESAIITDYYDKAQAYDNYKAKKLASDQLGWTVALEETGKVDGMGLRILRLKLTDSQHQRVSAAAVNVACYHWSHADQSASLIADAGSDGSYTFSLPRTYSGFWSFDVSAKQGEKQFINTFTQYVN